MTVKSPHAASVGPSDGAEDDQEDSDAEENGNGGGGWESDADGSSSAPTGTPNGHGRRAGVSTQVRPLKKPPPPWSRREVLQMNFSSS